MKNKVFVAIAFAAVLATGFEFSVQPATAAQINSEQLTLKDEIVTQPNYVHRWWRRGLPR